MASLPGPYHCINIIYAKTLLHLRNWSAKLDSMISQERKAGVFAAQPSVTPAVFLSVGQLPELLPIIIQVAVPGPA